MRRQKDHPLYFKFSPSEFSDAFSFFQKKVKPSLAVLRLSPETTLWEAIEIARCGGNEWAQPTAVRAAIGRVGVCRYFVGVH